MTDSSVQDKVKTCRKPGRWKRLLKWIFAVTLALFALLAFLVKDDVRTLLSLRRVAGTNAYVMDYYGDYRIDKIRDRGMDVGNIEDSCLETLLPELVLPIAERLKRAYIPDHITTVEDDGHHCSTLAIQSKRGDVFLGRNFDYFNDACLILKVHDDQGLASAALIDLAYLNLNRSDLDQTNLIDRVPLLFAPYYVMDGMNRSGVAVSNMAVDAAEPPLDAGKPAIINSTLMRLILDYAQSADDAVKIIGDYNVHFVATPVHLMIADSSGRFLIVEYIDGEVRVTPSQESWHVCTNHIVWQKSESENDAACGRYHTASDAADELGGEVDVDDVMSIMHSVSAKDWTMWTSVYSLTTGDFRVAYKARLDAEFRDAIDGG